MVYFWLLQLWKMMAKVIFIQITPSVETSKYQIMSDHMSLGITGREHFTTVAQDLMCLMVAEQMTIFADMLLTLMKVNYQQWRVKLKQISNCTILMELI